MNHIPINCCEIKRKWNIFLSKNIQTEVFEIRAEQRFKKTLNRGTWKFENSKNRLNKTKKWTNCDLIWEKFLMDAKCKAHQIKKITIHLWWLLMEFGSVSSVRSGGYLNFVPHYSVVESIWQIYLDLLFGSICSKWCTSDESNNRI